jgi:hypothetical protein
MRPGVPETGKSSDQMPEEAPAEQVPDDVPEAEEGAARKAARRHVQKLSRSAQERDGAWEDAGGKDAHEGP